MNRIEQKMKHLQESGEKAVITYLPVVLQDPDRTAEIIRALDRGGCDAVELGIPFSDPVADGPVIADAFCRASGNGITFDKVSALTRGLREEGVEIPVLFVLYYNTVLNCGIKAFVEECAAAGADGVMIQDLPFEEQGEIRQYLDETENIILIQYISPLSGERIPMIASGARGFLSCMSFQQDGGETGEVSDRRRDFLTDAKSVSGLPVLINAGAGTLDSIKQMRYPADGVITGAHLVRIMEESGYAPDAAEAYCRAAKNALNGRAG